MPSANSVLNFKYGLQSNYNAISTKDVNTIYFTTDEQRLFVGDIEYTRPVQQGTVLPSGYQPPYSLFFKTDTKELYFSDGDEWTKCSNLSDYTHPTSTVTAGAYGDTAAQTPEHGGKFKVPSFTVDANGHLTVAGSHDVTLPAETQLSKADASGTPGTLTHGGKFTATTGLAVSGHKVTETKTEFTLPAETELSKGADTAGTAKTLTHSGKFSAVTGYTVSGHKITAEVTEFTLPEDENTTYTFATGTANGTIDVTPSGGTTQSVTVKGLAGAAYKTVDTTVSSTSENLPTSKAVQTAINSAIAGVTQFDVQVVTELPTTGQKGVIYLVSHSHDTKDVYDEYIWNTAATTPAFEKIGSTDIDLSAYLTSADAADTYIPKVTGASGKVAQFDAKGNVVSSGYTIAANVPSDAKFTDTVYTHPAGNGTSKASGLYKFATDGTSHISSVTSVTKDDITGLGIPAQDTKYGISSARGDDGQINVTLTAGGTGTSVNVPVMDAATASAAGAAGLVPAPSAGDQTKFLKADGTWAIPANTTYTAGAGLTLSDNAFKITNSVTANTAGLNTGDKTLSWGSTTTLNTVKYDANGLITGTGTYTLKMPANPNTDKAVEQNAAITTDGAYPVILAGSTATTAMTGAVNKASNFTFNPSTGALSATSFTGNAATATTAVSAGKATNDGAGNSIVDTYATKAELTASALKWGSF